MTKIRRSKRVQTLQFRAGHARRSSRRRSNIQAQARIFGNDFGILPSD